MSFSSQIKDKLCLLPLQCERCVCAELSGIFSFGAKVEEQRVFIKTEHEGQALRIQEDIRRCTGADIAYTGDKTRHFEITGYTARNLNGALMLGRGYSREECLRELMPFSCCRASYIRGAFLGGGSVSDPQKGYHLEFDTKNEFAAGLLKEVLEQCGFHAKITLRKNHYIVYMKECGVIADILGFIGAGYGAMELYNVQIEKEMRNAVNRRVNCETANVVKTTRAASKQIWAIHKIRKNMDMDRLPEALQEIAKLRLEYPEESLKDLGSRVDPPIGKSGVNHRLNRLIAIAEELD